MTYTVIGKHIVSAARASADLHIFAAVAALMESSLVSSDCERAEFKIIEICKREQAKCLARYDRAVAKADGGTYGR